MLIQATFALLFALVAAIFHEQLIDNVFEGATGLYVVLIVGTLAYTASYFAGAGSPATSASGCSAGWC